MDQKRFGFKKRLRDRASCPTCKRNFGATVTPLGEANLLLSPDLLDGSRAIQYLSAGEGRGVIGDDFQVPLSFIMDRDAPTRGELIEKNERENIFLELPSLKQISVKVCGKSVYANAMALGVAYQKGLLPFKLSEMESAFKRGVTNSEVANNVKAFHLGDY